MFNFLRDFIPCMAEVTAPLRTLLKKGIEWHWTEVQQQAFDKLKDIVSTTPVLKHFDPKQDITIQCDASQNGLGACLLQNKQPVAYISRSLTETEKAYPQIEKECLSLLFSIRRFHNYVWGRKIKIETDHLPLISIFRKNINTLISNRLVKMRLAMLQYDLDVTYLPGRQMVIADLLSRNYLEETYENEIEIKGFVHDLATVNLLSLDQDTILKVTKSDKIISDIIHYVKQGWPDNKSSLPKNEVIRHFYKIRNNLCINENGLLFYNARVVIPEALKPSALKSLHSGHMGIQKTLLRAQETMYWININNDVESFIKKCYTCETHKGLKHREPLMPIETSTFPFERVCLDIMTHKSKDYLVVVDSYSKWIELYHLKSKKCSEIINKLKTLFSIFGIPICIMSDNSPFNSNEIKIFCKQYNIKWLFSSPLYPNSNGLSERAVQICKNILKKSDTSQTDYRDLLTEYRATKIPALGFSPSEILMGRLIRTKICINNEKLNPIKNLENVHKNLKSKMKEAQINNKYYYDRKTREEKPFYSGENVLVREGNRWIKGKIIKSTEYPRSYWVNTERGSKVRRNTFHLKHTPITFQENEVQDNFEDNFDDFLEINSSAGLIMTMSNNSNNLNLENVLETSSSLNDSDESFIRTLNEAMVESVHESEDENTSRERDNNLDNNVHESEEENSSSERDSLDRSVHDDHSYIKRSKSGRPIIRPARFKC
ncbi:uncharacterized protein LOC103523326 isoform X4 [Diaphorina citri]|uniref:RNA-directed DNA polymerase n=1 Tax=Diaphorina citri TaxID=121845 RepID=A0A3Q0JPH1_DIACI|nr:uncharacterized protein LOC103523326 isoform X2 [Diaphorina citri]XP_026688737.1 uncharacterized protein LOC103523326 isoform X4 [Diaphorina citri]